MATLPLIPEAILILFAIFTLMFGVLDDLRKREVSSFLFVPLFLAAIVLYAIYNFSPAFVGISSAFFILTFLKLKPIPYAIGGIILIVIAFIVAPTEYKLYFLVLFLMFIVGAGGQYFGVADVKAFLSVSFISFTQIPNLFGAGLSPIMKIIPFDFYLLLNTSIISVFFIPYLILLNRKLSGKFRTYHLYALDYNESLYKEHPERYRITERAGEKIMVYGAPSLVAIYIGFIASLALGPWFLYL